MNAPVRRSLEALGVAVAYYGAAHLGLLLALPGTNVSPVWPPTGIALGAVLVFGPHVAAGVFVGELAANTQVFIQDGTLPWAGALLVSVAFATGNSLEALLGWRMCRSGLARAPTDSARSAAFLIRTAMLITLVSTTFGLGALWAAGLVASTAIPSLAVTWWLGNLGGIALFTPLILAARAHRGPLLAPLGRREGLTILVVTFALPVLVFTGMLAPIGLTTPFIVVPTVLWAVFRGNGLFSSAVLSSTAMLGLAALAGGYAPATLGADGSQIVQLDIVVAGGAFFILLAQGAIADHRRTEARERGLAEALEQRVAAQTRQIHDTHARLTAIISNAQEAILGIDKDGRIESANPAASKLFQASPEELRGDRLDAWIPALKGLPPGRPPPDLVLRRPAGQLAVEMSWASAEIDGQVFHTAFIRDVSDRLESERRRPEAIRSQAEVEHLKEREAFRTSFLNQAAHELRTPLTPLLLQSSLLGRMSKDLPPAGLRSLDALDRNLRRLKRIVDDLLDAGRFQADRLALNKVAVPLDEVVRQVVEDHAPAIEAAGLRLRTDIASDVWVHGDADRIAQMVHNLLSNAHKYTQEGGIIVRLDSDGTYANIHVTDTGLGIPSDQIDQLFQPFARIHEDHAIPGTGLGLYVSRSLAKLHGGELTASSRGEGQGATFTIRLPVVSPAIEVTQVQ